MSLYKIKLPPLERYWYRCPHCGAKLLLYDNTAVSHGVFIKCKLCKKEIEISIEPESHMNQKG